MDTLKLGIAVDNTDAIAKINAVTEAATRAKEAIDALNAAIAKLQEPATIKVEVRDQHRDPRRFA